MRPLKLAIFLKCYQTVNIYGLWGRRSLNNCYNSRPKDFWRPENLCCKEGFYWNENDFLSLYQIQSHGILFFSVKFSFSRFWQRKYSIWLYLGRMLAGRRETSEEWWDHLCVITVHQQAPGLVWWIYWGNHHLIVRGQRPRCFSCNQSNDKVTDFFSGEK